MATHKELLYAASRRDNDLHGGRFSESTILMAMDDARDQALRDYGQHKEDCKTRTTFEPEDCDCGFLAFV